MKSIFFVFFAIFIVHTKAATIWKDTATPKPADDEEVVELANLKGDAKDLPSLEQQLNALEEKKPRGQPEEATNDVPNEEDDEKGIEYESDIKPLLKTSLPSSTSPESKSQFLSRLRGMATSGQYGNILESNAVDYDEAAGRLRLADFLYAEYSLEEIIYQLAKVMFSQSLTKGSEHAHIALQRLTEFLESEGNYGRISPSLQKKVLDVLLAALSDTLADVQNVQHPSHKEHK